MQPPNPYTVLGFKLGDHPLREEVEDHYIQLVKNNHPEFLIARGCYDQITTAFNRIAAADFPSFEYFLDDAWEPQLNKNWVYRFSISDYGTVFQVAGSRFWRWVYRGQFSVSRFLTPQKAKADFISSWVDGPDHQSSDHTDLARG